jgi:hypothetical protein
MESWHDSDKGKTEEIGKTFPSGRFTIAVLIIAQYYRVS